MLEGRLGLEVARLPHADRHGLVWLDRGRLSVEEGCLTFDCAGGGMLPAGRYGLPHQSVSLMLLGPGSSVTHDALRLLARHSDPDRPHQGYSGRADRGRARGAAAPISP